MRRGLREIRRLHAQEGLYRSRQGDGSRAAQYGNPLLCGGLYGRPRKRLLQSFQGDGRGLGNGLPRSRLGVCGTPQRLARSRVHSSTKA